MSIATDGFGTIVSGLETGGGGGSVIPPDGDLSGTYEGTVVCEGNVTLTGNLDLKGNLIVLGDFVNDGGYEVTISGSLTAQSILFNKADTSTPQQNFSVGGDLMFTYMEFQQCGGTAAQLRVGGDLIGTAGFAGSPIFANGGDGTSGLNIIVYGNLTASIVDVNGGYGNAVNAGNGGNVTVYGDFQVWFNADLAGGDSNDADAGNGGILDVYGDIVAGVCAIYTYGGDATNGNAGNAGEIDCEGDILVLEVAGYGGDCTSDSEFHRSGSGGQIYAKGSLVSDGFINVSGGDRSGTLSAGASLDPPNAGEIDVKGSITAEDIDLNGGYVGTDNFAPHAAGNGGVIYVKGDLTLHDDLEVYGGSANQGNGGNGGSLFAESSVHVDDDFEFTGGYANNGNGGNGGNVSVNGDLYFSDGRLWGGDATNGNGGQGASLYVDGSVYCENFLVADGGYCNSINETHVPGNAGYLTVKGDLHYEGDDDSLTMRGGNRFGATTVGANTGLSGAQGGFIIVYGDLNARNDIDLYGGSTTTNYPNVRGGNGGSLTVYGSFTGEDIMLYAGQGRGSDGGVGGTFTCRGYAKFDNLSVAGGPSDASVVGGDAQAQGSAGSIYLRSGGVGRYILMSDGGAGSAATASVRLAFNGMLTLYQLNMTDRVDSWIVADDVSIPAMFKVNSMLTKQTLNNDVGTATGNISASLDGSLFITGLNSTWYAVAGVLA